MEISKGIELFFNYQRLNVKKNTLKNYEFILTAFQKHFGEVDQAPRLKSFRRCCYAIRTCPPLKCIWEKSATQRRYGGLIICMLNTLMAGSMSGILGPAISKIMFQSDSRFVPVS